MPQPNPRAPAPEIALALSAAEATERLLRDRQLHAALLPAAWLALLPALGARDRRDDRRRAWLLGLAMGGAVASFLLLVAAQPALALPVFLVAAALLVGYLRLRRRDLANHLRRFVVPLLRVLQGDLDPQAPLQLALRLRDRYDKQNLVDKRGSEERFRDRWLAGHARLRDGAVLDWEICDEICRWTVKRRGSSGKTKYKTKHRVRTQVEVSLGVPRDRYELRPAPGARTESGAKRDVVTVKQTFKRKDRDGAVTLREFLGVVAGAFRSVAPRAKGG